MIKKSNFINSLIVLCLVSIYFLLSNSLLAEDDIFIVEDKNKLTPIKLKDEEKEQKIKVDFSYNTFNDGSNNNELSWKPRWMTHGVASLALIGSTIIDNQIIFVEKAGKINGPQGALIITYDYTENSFDNIIKLSGYQIKNYKISPESNLLYATIKPQRCFEQKKDGVIIVDLESGKVLAKSLLDDEKDKVNDLNFCGNNIFISYYSEYDEIINIEIFDLSLKKKKKFIKTPFIEGLLIPLNDNQIAFLSKDGGIIIDGKSLNYSKKSKLNFKLTTKIAQGVYSENLEKFLLLTQQGLLLTINNDSKATKKIIANSVSSEFNYNEDNGFISFYNGSRRRLFVLNAKESFSSTALISTKSLKPRSPKGSSIKWSKVISANPINLLVFTSYGELYTVEFNKKRKKGTKKVLFKPIQ